MPVKPRKLNYGEKTFIVIFAIISVILFIMSVQMWQETPGWSGMAAFPLIISGIMMVTALWMLLEMRRCERSHEKNVSPFIVIKETLKYLFPGKLVAFILYVVLYAIFIKSLGFILCTFLFLWASMITLYPERNVKSAIKFFIISIVVLVGITLIFQYVFRVILP